MFECRLCRRELKKFLSFGKMPIANGFLREEDFGDEYHYDLAVGFCPQCTMVQLLETVDPNKLFFEAYAFYSSTSKAMTTHFGHFAQEVKSNHLKSTDPFVVELGSNDGIMLQSFSQDGIRHLGIEPSQNVAQVAKNKGIRTLCAFFNESLARNILHGHGQAGAILGANVMCHIPDLHSVARGVKSLLKPDGVFIFEDPYLGDIVEKVSFDQIYDEHVYYFSLTALQIFFKGHGLEIIDVAHQNVHGGSMRYTVKHWGRGTVSKSVKALVQKERDLNLSDFETLVAFSRKVQLSLQTLKSLLVDLKRQGKRVVGYGATSKSTTTIISCGLDTHLIDFISDTTPIKQGKFSPGAHIPVRSHDDFESAYPDHALLFAWNHAQEIMAKEQKFKQLGGKWIVYVPKVEVL